MHISQNVCFFFLLIDVFFDKDSKSAIRIFQTALFFELAIGKKERKNRNNKTTFAKPFLC